MPPAFSQLELAALVRGPLLGHQRQDVVHEVLRPVDHVASGSAPAPAASRSDPESSRGSGRPRSGRRARACSAAPASRRARPGRCGIGMLPPSGGGPGRTRLPGGVAPAWKYWLLPSDRRLSPDRPGMPRWSCARTGWSEFSASLPVSGFGIFRPMTGTSTLFVQADSARDSRRNGTEVWSNLTRSGIVWRRTRAVPRSSSSDIRRRACVMNGMEAASVGSDERTPGSASWANARRRRQRRVERGERRVADLERVAQRRHRLRERHVLARERGRGHVEVRDEALEGVLVLDQRGERLLLPLEQPLDVVVRVLARASRRWRATS